MMLSRTQRRMMSLVSRSLPCDAQASDSSITFFQKAHRLPALPLGTVGKHLHPQCLGVRRVLMNEPAARKDTACQIVVPKYVAVTPGTAGAVTGYSLTATIVHCNGGGLHLRRKTRTCHPATA